VAKGTLIKLYGRVLHLVARFAPGATGFRPFLHRLRGVQIGKDVFIGDEVYLENEYPERVEIHDGVQISVRATILAHTRGPGRVVLEKNAYIGPHVLLVTSEGRVLRIGEGAVVGAGCVITKDVESHTFITGEFGKAIAEVRLPLSRADRLEDFIKGLVPLKSRSTCGQVDSHFGHRKVSQVRNG
jgi:bifunctional N-acetylglucosamine-1-phosphate-uridyltransferase/glucosamine-1-phosphate-acetyltransferase GlmU-like protein